MTSLELRARLLRVGSHGPVTKTRVSPASLELNASVQRPGNTYERLFCMQTGTEQVASSSFHTTSLTNYPTDREYLPGKPVLP